MIDEKQHLLQELHDYEDENKIQAGRIKEMESMIEEFLLLDEDSYDSTQLRWEINRTQNVFRQFLNKQ